MSIFYLSVGQNNVVKQIAVTIRAYIQLLLFHWENQIASIVYGTVVIFLFFNCSLLRLFVFQQTSHYTCWQ